MSGKKLPEITVPWCPFCGLEVARPDFAKERKLNEFPFGTCECGAVYVSEATGHNIGAALVECLVAACHQESDLAWELVPEEDYLTGRVEDYDEQTHQVIAKRNLDGREIRGVLYFVRLHKDIAEIAERFKEKLALEKSVLHKSDRQRDAGPAVEPERNPKRSRRRADKSTVRELVFAGDEDQLVDLAFDDKRSLRFLQRLLYTPVEDERFAVAWMLGRVCARLSTREPGPVADLLHRLFDSSADSAASSWGMVEGIGAVVANRSDIFGAFTRHIFQFLGDQQLRFAALWGLTEIAERRPDLVRATPFYGLLKLLNHPDGRVRGMTARLLGRISAREAAFQVMGLEGDTTEIRIYAQGDGLDTTVGAQAFEAGQRMHQGETHGK
ncbi:MAG: PBS lyase [Desulfobulbus propionicus]|nr:MAG: PBS lyase [Desulfobulbus propionicus]